MAGANDHDIIKFGDHLVPYYIRRETIIQIRR
jgi:hypothetical protein